MQKKIHGLRLPATVLAAFANALLMSGSTEVYAQSSAVLEEVVVTARRRQESMQDVPVAVSAFSGDQLRDSGVVNIKDLTMQVPGLMIDENSTGQIWIRGIGQRDDSSRIDSPVGVYLDNLYIARKDAQLLDTMDVESMQVLRGPQGTLFGKNTTAGAILVNTTKPDDSLGGYVEARAGNYDRRDGKVVVNVPLVDEALYSRATVMSVKRDGYMNNVVTGQEMASEDRLGASLQLRWLPADSVTVDSFAYYNKTREVQAGSNCKWLQQSGFGGQDALFQNQMWGGDVVAVWPLEGMGFNAAAGSAITGIPQNEVSQTYSNACDRANALLDDNDVAMDAKYSYELDNKLFGVTVEWELNEDLMLRSITGYGDQRLSGLANSGDNDGAEGHFSSRYRTTPSDREQLSQELQLVGTALNSRLSYTVGAFAMVEDIDDGGTYQFRSASGFFIPAATLFGAPPPATDIVSVSLPTAQLDFYELQNTTYALFAQGSYDFTDNLQLTLGIRWTSEERETDLAQQVIDGDVYTQTILDALEPIYGPAIFEQPSGDVGYAAGLIPQDILGQIDALFPTDSQGAIQYPLAAPQTFSDDKTWTEASPMASLSYNLPASLLGDSVVDDGMVYFTYSEGFKSGTFEPFGSDGLRAVDPETVTNFELGMKLDAFERRVRLNMAAFVMQYEDMQLRQVQFSSAGDPVVVLTNASESEVRGVELELTWQPVAGLLINAGGSYNDYEFKEFDDVQFSTVALLTQQPLPTVDRSDETFPEVSDKTLNVGIQYSWATDAGIIQPRLDYRYNSEIFMGLDAGSWGVRRQSTVSSYEVVNARVTWISPSHNVEVAAYVTNLTDEEYFFGAAAVGDTVGTFPLVKGPPRMYGLQVLYRFGDM